MNPYPKIQLSRIRQIGWDQWDPIGIRSFGTDGWKEGAADEYDAYLLQVVSRLHRGEPIESAVSYLDQIASEHMGLGPLTDEGHRASVATVEAILTYLKTLPDGPLGVR